MARIRTLKPAFWKDPDVCRMSRDARLTAIALISYADDRGRLEYSAPVIRGFAFQRDNVTDRRVHSWMVDVVASGLASAYEDGGFPYLWLPKFWVHQVINRPTESLLPAHPDDPYGHLAVREALRQCRDDLDPGDSVSDSPTDSVSDSRSNHGGLTASRAGGRSLPTSPSSSVVDVSNSNVNGNSHSARKPRVDQTAWPDELSPEQRATGGEVLAILRGVWEIRGGSTEPQQRGVGLGMLRNPRADHVDLARRMQHWFLAGKGQRAATGDIAKRFGDWCAEEPAGKPSRSANGHGGGALSQGDLDARRLASMRKLMSEKGVKFA